MLSPLPVCRKRKRCPSVISEDDRPFKRLLVKTTTLITTTATLTTTPTTTPIDSAPTSEWTCQTITSQIALDILLKHEELRQIDTEIAKCQVALEQIRRCTILPADATANLEDREPGNRKIVRDWVSERAELEKRSKFQLSAMLKDRSLQHTGVKADLISRLLHPEYSIKKKTELTKILKSRGLPHDGGISAMFERLQKDDEKIPPTVEKEASDAYGRHFRQYWEYT